MELIDGPSLEREIGALKGRPDLVRRIMLAVLDAVGHAHARGVVHRDLKPANVLLATAGDEVVPKVTDFGIAKVTIDDPARGKQSTHGNARMGTLSYMSPEQIKRAKDATPRSDIFSLGAMLYEMATGTVAFGGDSDYDVMDNIIHGRYEAPARVNERIDPRFAEVITRALAPDPADRFASCEEMAVALGGRRPATTAESAALTQHARTPLAPPPVLPRAQAVAAPRRAYGFAAVALLVGALGGGATVLATMEPSRGTATEDEDEDDDDSGQGADQVIGRMVRMADQLCACKDMACAEGVMKKMSSIKEPSGKPSKAQFEQAMKIAEKMAGCQKKIMEAEMPAPPSPPP